MDVIIISLYPAPSLLETQDRLSLVDIHNLLAVVVISRLTSPPPHPHPYPTPPPPTLSTPTPPPPPPPATPPPPPYPRHQHPRFSTALPSLILRPPLLQLCFHES